MTDTTTVLTEAEQLAAYQKLYGPLPEAKPAGGTGTTHILMCCDMSGSMAHLAADVRGGFNTYVTDLAGQPGTYRLTATLFDTEFIPLCVDAPLDQVPMLDGINYRPRGGTALFEAVGRTVTEFEQRIPELGEHDRVLVVIQTDGEENSSGVEWRDPETVAKLIRSREATGKWSFIYLGAGQDTWTQARAMGVQQSSYVNTSATSHGTRSTYDGLTRGTASFAAGASGAEASRIVAATPGAVDPQ